MTNKIPRCSASGSIISGIVLVNAILVYKHNKRLKSFEITAHELQELNNKMHDRLVDVEFKIKSGKSIPQNLCKRLLYNSSRLIRHDETINYDVHSLINSWESARLLHNQGNITSGELSVEQAKLIRLIARIKNKVNKLQIK